MDKATSFHFAGLMSLSSFFLLMFQYENRLKHVPFAKTVISYVPSCHVVGNSVLGLMTVLDTHVLFSSCFLRKDAPFIFFVTPLHFLAHSKDVWERDAHF